MANVFEQNTIPSGGIDATTPYGDYNQIAFVIQQAMTKMQTSTLVKVVACTNSGGVSPVGFVDVVPMVAQLDSNGVGHPHTTIFNLPYLRIQGGSNGIIIDPEPGDIGIACFASRDITKVKNTRAPAVPGSYRTYDYADGMYLGGMLNGAPNQYVQFNSAGVKILSPSKVEINAPTVEINASTVTINASTVDINASTSSTVTTPIFTVNGDVQVNGGIGGSDASFTGTVHADGDITTDSDVIADNDVLAGTISLNSHLHSGVQSGGNNSGPPVP
jgi:hypothetical protein